MAHMEYDPDILIDESPDVYPPSEDSLLLIRSFDVTPGEKVLELGCGSGIVSLHCAKAGAVVTAGDLNPSAVRLTKKNGEKNNLNVNVVLTDVYDSVDGKFDTVVFNLPYLPVDDDLPLAEAWSGGEDGLGPLPRVLEGIHDRGNDGWRIVVVVSSLMDEERLDSLLAPYRVTVLGELPLFFEKLRVLQISADDL
ncbi:MAG: HemK2/MTQ2 family protein methyltransferase [Candidatus Methanomethylophilaceae archaeon]|jgi:release factor glutamine methyltransferase